MCSTFGRETPPSDDARRTPGGARRVMRSIDAFSHTHVTVRF
jgi:hypothetical protein